MLFDPARHEPLQTFAWDEARVRQFITRIVRETEARVSPDGLWPTHSNDADPEENPRAPLTPLYHGACGVVWALGYLEALGAVELQRDPLAHAASLRASNRAWLEADDNSFFGSLMMGETPWLLLEYGRAPGEALARRLAGLIEGNIDNPTRELMWGSPGTLLAASFLHERTGDERWADLFRRSAAQLASELKWSDEHGCHYWTQDLYGREVAYLDGVHGFVGTVLPLIRGRHLLDASSWSEWESRIVNTLQRTVTLEDGAANWRALLTMPAGREKSLLMQLCHGAPGFIVCTAHLPSRELDPLLLAGGEAIWTAGPLAKGSNLCHGTGGNGYAFLVLYQRTGEVKWLERARAFAMHGIAQSEADEAAHGQLRYSLWTGDLGFAIYLWDCLRGEAAFPTLDVFYGAAA
ncbi:lanthionine synthetase C family protein [Paraburkholderia sp. BCC1885]|uniref:lanthionine synthetase C family protein n=1 Tax=Paraburkholderia sp. BCC1885 TaxID=2562669 RepID=UPI001642D866|nr:LanC-like protein [Paraburkholderia sp. BCC1885]